MDVRMPRERMSIELRSERLVLRPIEAGDREALHRLWTDPDVRRFLWDDRVIDLATVDGVIERSSASFAAEGFGLFTLHGAGGGALVGCCGIYRLAQGLEPELIYSLAPGCWRRGLAVEAARVVIADAFTRLGFALVRGRTDTPNRASIRVLERLGMAFESEGVENGLPTVCYALSREAWLAQR
jgi:RimJ/RimL family protein N-acetyltransferase